MTETRAEKAQRLVDEGRVEIILHAPDSTSAYVRGDEDVHYTFCLANGHFYCDCDWGSFHSYTDDLCAHALAVKLATEKEKER